MVDLELRQKRLQGMSFPVSLNANGSLHYSLPLTNECNLSCQYCYNHVEVNSSESLKFSAEEIIEVIAKIFREYPEGKATFDFFGGEPLLNFSVLKTVFEYLETNYRSRIISYDICTNGTVVNEEIINFLKQNKDRISLAFSLDGNRDSNSARVFNDGSASFDRIVEGIRTYFENDVWVKRVTFIAHPNNVNSIFDGVLHLISLGFKKIRVAIVESTIKIDQAFIDKYIEEMKKFSDYVKEHPEIESVNFKTHLISHRDGPFIMVRGKPVVRRISGVDHLSRIAYGELRDTRIKAAYDAIYDYHNR